MTHEHEEPVLFDLPLAPPPAGEEAHDERQHEEPAPRRSRSRAARPESLSLFDEDEADASDPAGAQRELRRARREYERIPPAMSGSSTAPGPRAVPRPEEETGIAEDQLTTTAPVATRLRASAGDLVVLIAVGALAAVGARALGGVLIAATLPALATFLAAFSFLYCVVSLAFWGQTPGMAWSGLVARTDETEPLSFGQTALRWLGHWLTWMLLGVPALLALTGRSLADRLSGSEIYELPARG
ncbi:MAG: RDD family protein [Thermoanaerobaculia bacterium]